MSDFRLIRSQLPDALSTLRAVGGPFLASEEYGAVNPDLRQLPYLAFGALGSFLSRAVTGEASEEERGSVSTYIATIERLAEMKDPDVDNALVVSVFEVFDPSMLGIQELVRHLGPNSRALWERWIVPTMNSTSGRAG